MENSKNTKYPAVKMKEKRNKKLLRLKHCCIPATCVKTETIELEDGTTMVVNPDIKPNGNGTFGKAGQSYKDLKKARIKSLKSLFIKKGNGYCKIRRKQPWYTLMRKKHYIYEERKESYGSRTDYFKKKSEYFSMYKRTIIPKFTREELIIRLLSAKLADWEKKNPRPSKDSMFYWQEMKPWINSYQAAHSAITGSMGLLKKTPLPEFVKESYEKYEKEFNKEYEEHWQKQKAA